MKRETMSTLNFSLYFDALLMMNRGEGIDQFSEKVVENLENWGYIVLLEDVVIITQKGLNVMEFYLRNRDFMTSCTQDLQEVLLRSYSE